MINGFSFIAMIYLHSFISPMNLYLTHLILLLTFAINLIQNSKLSHRRFRRREWIQEEIRKHLFTSITSLKGEITDVILDEMMEYYNTQSSKLYQLEKEVRMMKNFSLPWMRKRKRSNHLIHQLFQQQQSIVTDLSHLQEQLINLTSMFNHRHDDFPIDCDDVLRRNRNLPSEGIFRIQPRLSPEPFDVLCQFENEQGWTVIQRRINGTVNFYRDWKEYKDGFGQLRTEFWLGNERIYQLTNQDHYTLRIDLQPWMDSLQFAQYGHFLVHDETNDYKLNISDYYANISTAGDSLSSSWDNANDVRFSTFDRDHDRLFYDNCASIYQGAWWFTSCFQSHLNGLYIRSPLALENTARNGLHWNTYGLYHSMKETQMRIRRPSKSF